MKISKKMRLLLLGSFCFLAIVLPATAQNWNPNHSIGTASGNYGFSYNQTPESLIEIHPAAFPNTGLSYQWEKSLAPTASFVSIAGATQSSYNFTSPLSQTTYYRRKTTNGSLSIYSNIIKITVVSVNWENRNYIRQHNVLVSGQSTWQQVDQLPIGQKLQTTSFMDGLGRSVQEVAREIATPASGTGPWGDLVQFSKFDGFGREVQRYLPYTTTSNSGKFKTNELTEQSQYYSTVYNETHSYSQISFDQSPLQRATNVKNPGTAWNASAGNSAAYDMNTAAENVQMFTSNYLQERAPVHLGAYPPNSLYKVTYTDVNGKMVVEYMDKSGQQILKKVQLSNTPSASHHGWICVYTVYDDFGQVRFQLQPEAVNYFEENSNWSFEGAEGEQILNELCFQYDYDDRGRLIWKKAPGAKPLRMIYDERDRIVFTQDGNQEAMSTPQWTATLYDELDRPVLTTLYHTNKTTAQLQTDINNAVTYTTVVVNNPALVVNGLVINNRINNTPDRYAARTSIDFVADAGGSFESATGDEFVAEIDPTATQAGYIITTALYESPISQADLNNGAVTTILSYQFYDDYSFASAKTFTTEFTSAPGYTVSDPQAQAIARDDRTLGMLTGSMVRVLGSTTFLSATFFYDLRGSQIQMQDENIKGGTDIVTNQYHFDGRVLHNFTSHTAPGTDYTGFQTTTRYGFDLIGRVSSVMKFIGTNPAVTIATYQYDDMGRLKTKSLDPNYNDPLGGTGLESLSYSYNILNQITGINKDYALKTPLNYDKWEHYFGMYLGFDNRDNVFTNAQLNGQVGGILWSTQGDDAQRRYDFTYDNANRLILAAFTEKKHTGDAWSNSGMDFSVMGSASGGGKIRYDLNGNLLDMLQRGVIPGSNTPVDMDKLLYTYTPLSNKLEKVTDETTATASNGMSGDFKDGSNGITSDYVYDENGNLIVDLNKNVQSLNNGAAGTKGIVYNHLDKPELIRITGKGHIRIIYDAGGRKLQRAFIPEAGGASTITSYVNEYQYSETATLTTASTGPLGGSGPVSLSQINFEQGRIRVVTPVNEVAALYGQNMDGLAIDGNIDLPGGKRGAWDYFITDYQQNVRMILTEQVHAAFNTATMETSRSALEESIFGQAGAANEVLVTRVGKPTNWSADNLGNSVSRLGNLSGHNLGPNALQKVMAGDLVSTTAQYYFEQPPGNANLNITGTVITGILQALASSPGASNLVKDNVSGINTQLGANTSFTDIVNNPGAGNGRARAYLTLLFFDERFRLIESVDGGVYQDQVESSVTSIGAPLALNGKRAPQNGYVYAYLSNSSDQHIYFDNFMLRIDRGHVVEENHYYAYGLRIAALSSQRPAYIAEGSAKNNYLYNGKELFEDGDLNWYDYGFRNYDAQIGRFVELDPLTDHYPFLTPFQFAGCDPIANTDLDGLEPQDAIVALFSIPGASIKEIKAGKYIRKWSVTWFENGIAHAKVFAYTANETLLGAGKIVQVGRPLIDNLSNNNVPKYQQEIQKPLPVYKQAYFVQSNKTLKNEKKKEEYHDPYIQIIKKDRIENNRYRETDDMPLVGPLIQGTRRFINNDFTGADASFQRFKLDLALSVIPVSRFGLSSNAAKGGGRLGNASTRTQISEIATELESRGYTITRGGGRFPEEYLKPLGGGRKGGSYLDLTATHPKYGTLRINTVDVYKNGSPTLRELNNAARIRTQIAPGEHLLLIPKR